MTEHLSAPIVTDEESALVGCVLPENAVIEGVSGLPDGFVPDRTVPTGFVLQATLTTEALGNNRLWDQYMAADRRLRYRYGRQAVVTEANAGIAWTTDPAAIAVATFLRFDAKPLPRLTRARRTVHRALYGIQCDINF